MVTVVGVLIVLAGLTLVREIAVVRAWQPELTVQDAQQRLAQAQGQQHQQPDYGALAAQPSAQRAPLPLELTIRLANCRSDTHTTPTS